MARRRNEDAQGALGHEDRAVEINECWLQIARSRVGASPNSSTRFSRSGPLPYGRALHRELLGGRNTARKLMCREIGQLRGRMPPRPDENFCTEKFRRFKLQEEFFVHSGMEDSAVTGITVANDFIFVVASPGVCRAFRQTKNGSIAPYRRDGQIWHFNNPDERVKLVFYNKINDSIIIVSCTSHGNGYDTRALPLESIRRCNHSDNGVPIFGDRSMHMPVFYDHNIALVPHSKTVNNVHEMTNYNLVHSFRSKNIIFVTSRPGILIIAYMYTQTYLPIEVLSTENWTVLKKMNYAVPPRGFDIIWIYHDNILMKEIGEQIIHIFDIWNDDSVSLIKQLDKHPQNVLAINDLTANRLLLRFSTNIVVASCNSLDVPVALLEDNEVPGNNDRKYFNSDKYVTRDNKYAMIYSRKHIEEPRQGINILQEFSCIGSINIYDTFNGEPVWKINPYDDVDLAIGTRKEGGHNMANTYYNIHEALQNVTVLFYDEERHRIYTGNRKGCFHLWSN